MNKLKELQAAVEQFCFREYGRQKQRMTGSDFTLYAVDCGGYDITNDVVLTCKGNELTLIVHTNVDETEIKRFKLRVVEE